MQILMLLSQSAQISCLSTTLLLILVIARISVQNTNLHLEVGRSGLGSKIECNEVPNLRTDQNKTIIASICNTGLRKNVFV